jgi:transposase
VLFVAEGSSEESLDAFWAALTEEQKAGAQAMEMWDPYVNSTRRHLPEADGKIVFDKFHIAQNNRSKSACTFDLA